MSTTGHQLRRVLDEGGLALGMGLRHIRTADVGRMLAVSGYDWALIDLEHSAMSLDDGARLAVACQDSGVSPLVRVPRDQHHSATRLLDSGAMGVVFPHVDTADQASWLAQECLYPPAGHRSMGGSRSSQLGYLSYDRAELATKGNQATFLVMMIETPTGVENAEAIAGVPGVDALLIGANDLTLEMGIPGQLGHDLLRSACEAVVAACATHGKQAGLGGVYELGLMETYMRLGIRLVLAAGDTNLFINGASEKSGELRRLAI